MNLVKKITEVGTENCIFLVSMHPMRIYLGLISIVSNNSPTFIVPCKITEERYKLSENYKITLKPIYKQFAKEHFYISDLEKLISEGVIEFFTKEL